MKASLTVAGIFQLFCLLAQDGSNIKYYDVNEITESFVGKQCIIDYGSESFGGHQVDTFKIIVNGDSMNFYEHREDDGYNNWFDEQYFIRTEDKTIISTRLQNSVIDSLTSDKIYLISTLGYYINETPIDSITIFCHWFAKENISKVLIEN